MPTGHLCDCTFRGCGNSINSRTGKRGKLLPVRAYRTHQTDEAKQLYTSSLTERRARDAQHVALQNQENELIQHLSGLTISPRTTVLEKEAKYKVDHKRALIHKISMCQEMLQGLLEDADAIPIAEDHSPSEHISSSVSKCRSIREASNEIRQTLHNASNGSLKKEASIIILLEDATSVLCLLTSHLDAIELGFTKIFRERVRVEEQFIKTGHVFDTRNHFYGPLNDSPPLVQLSLLMVVVCHVILGFPRRGCHWLLTMGAYIIETTFHQSGVAGHLLSYFQKILRQFPKDVRSATDNFDLEGKSLIYAVCPSCHECHKPSEENNIFLYPQRCTSHRYGKRCGEILLRPKNIAGHQVFLPIKPYVVFDFRDWLARLVSRKGFEDTMDGAWSRMVPTQTNGVLEDIFQASVVRDFKGPDGITHFSQAGPDHNTGRYLFSMGCDFFNPLRNLANGKRVSIGVIAFVCLNLPISLRYKPENIFLAGIIPGPKEPSLDAINPYLRPFVEVFLRFWSGIKFTQTSRFSDGRWILCALIAVICDLPAARKVGGFASCSHEYFCSICWCNLTEQGYNNADYSLWKRRTSEDCRSWANRYQAALTKEAASRIFNASGLRSSELLCLPYFDPTRHLVVDPMHNLFLGIIKEHFQNILGYLPKGVKPKGRRSDAIDGQNIILNVAPSSSNPVSSDPNCRKSVRKLIRVLSKPLNGNFAHKDTEDFKSAIKRFKTSIHMSSLVYVARAVGCIQNNILPDGSDASMPSSKKLQKHDLAQTLIEWRLRQQVSIASPVTRKHGFVLAEREIEELWKDISNMIKPSWATHVPNNISSAGAKLKSDQWRSIGSLYLPVTLIRLWSMPLPQEDCDEIQEQHALLHLTMLLCSAVSVITSRIVSERQADIYLEYMIQYRAELRRLFPDYVCHANHHMAMHLGEFLRAYGPVHGWWTFPFERMIGRLQRVLTNYKIGEYEATIGRSWTRAANFRAIFLKDKCPTAIKFCAKMFETLVGLENRNSLGEHSQESEEDLELFDEFPENRSKPISTEIQRAFEKEFPGMSVPAFASTKARISVDGISYCRKTVHEGNSGVLMFGLDTPFSIVDILQLPAREPIGRYWLVVRPHKQADVTMDPYARYPDIRAKLWSNDLEDSPRVIPLSSVETHFAKCLIEWEEKELAVVISLSKTHVTW